MLPYLDVVNIRIGKRGLKTQNTLVECYYNHTITRFSIQTAGLAFGGTGLCSYRVRGVGAVVKSIQL